MRQNVNLLDGMDCVHGLIAILALIVVIGVFLSMYLWFRYKMHRVIEELSAKYERVTELEKQESENIKRYRDTVLSRALQFMIVNLSTNEVIELTVPKNPEITIKYLLLHGIIKSNSYTRIVSSLSSSTLSFQ